MPNTASSAYVPCAVRRDNPIAPRCGIDVERCAHSTVYAIDADTGTLLVGGAYDSPIRQHCLRQR
ncbi:hypothetical protein C8Q76DRAFT_705397 [Earliella scabrosa]|nr:hypothetical protein C8Q76DRAFT_705397 [Earliella scabrosa]